MIVDYATLQQRVAAWLARADLTSAIPDFIQLAEANLSREIRARQMQAEVTGTSVNGVIPIPADLYGIQSLRLSSGGYYQSIRPVPPDQQHGYSGPACAYTVVNDQIRLLGTTDAAYVLTYRQKIPALSDTNQQNWLILRDPGAYLYGALCEASPYLADDARVATWGAQFQRIVDGINAHYDLENYGNAPVQQVGFNAP